MQVGVVMVTRQILRFENASLMQAVVAGLKPPVCGRVVVVVVAGRTVVDVVGGRVVDVVVVDVVVVDVVLVDVVVVDVTGIGSARLAQLVRQAPKAARQTATLVGCAQALRHATNAANVSAVHFGSPWHREPACVHVF